MSIDLSDTFASWEGIERSLAQLRSERDTLEAFFAHELEDLDKLRSELVDRSEKLEEERNARAENCQQLEQQQRDLEQRQHALEEQQQHLEQERASLDEQHQANQVDVDSLDDKSRRLAEANAELMQVRAKLSDEVEQSKAQQQQSEQAWQAQIEQLEESRKQLSEQLAAAEKDAGSAAEVKQSFDELQTRFDAAQAELVALRVAQPAEAELSAAQSESAKLREQLAASGAAGDEDVQRHIVELEEDRTALELELEAVRNRATELADNAAEEKRLAAEERAEWASELKQLRLAMENQASFLKENDGAHEVVTGQRGAGRTTKAETSNGNDPMLDSLMDQFQQLQKDRIQRRANARAAPQQEVA